MATDAVVCYLIDDDEDDREFFSMALEEVGRDIDLKTSDNAEDALICLRSREVVPDIVFLDINMPRIDGWECLRLIRETPHLAGTPVIIYSTAERGFRSRQYSNYNGFLTKQAKISDLVVKLREIFSETNI